MSESEQLNIFKNWQHSHLRAILKIARVYATNPVDRDDLLQEIALQIWGSIPGFKGQCTELTWIYRVALNTALKWVRKERKRVLTEPLEHVDQVLAGHEAILDEQLEWLYKEIYSLGLIDRCMVLLLLDDFSYKEMATILGITESNVGVKISRIKKHLTEKSKQLAYGI